MNSLNAIAVIGIDGSGPSHEGRKALEGAQVVFGARRFKALAPPGSEFRPITPIDEMIKYVAGTGSSSRVAVLASGDPLFFGIGSRLLDQLPPERLQFFPALTSIQELCARAKVPWGDISLASLHGRARDMERLILQEIRPDATIKAAFVTGPGAGPAEIARACMGLGIKRGTMIIGENLGMDSERVLTIPLEEACVEREFSPLNCAILLAQAPGRPDGLFGRKEDYYARHRGLITKPETRAAVLAALELPRQGTMWDIGAGSGSISVEAAGLRPGLKVYAVEKDKQRIEDIEENRIKACSLGVKPVEGIAPAALSSLPEPDRVFIGGGGQNTGKIIDACLARLNGAGPVVATAVCIETLNTVVDRFNQALFRAEVCQISISRMLPLGTGHVFRPENPIFLIKATRE